MTSTLIWLVGFPLRFLAAHLIDINLNPDNLQVLLSFPNTKAISIEFLDFDLDLPTPLLFSSNTGDWSQ